MIVSAHSAAKPPGNSPPKPEAKSPAKNPAKPAAKSSSSYSNELAQLKKGFSAHFGLKKFLNQLLGPLGFGVKRGITLGGKQLKDGVHQVVKAVTAVGHGAGDLIRNGDEGVINTVNDVVSPKKGQNTKLDIVTVTSFGSSPSGFPSLPNMPSF